MRTIEDQMSFYAAYHQDARNKATHFIGVPAIMLSLFIPLAWVRLFEVNGFVFTAAMLFAAVVLVYYFVLDFPLGLAMLVILQSCYGLRKGSPGLKRRPGWTWFRLLFVGGWILRLVGHVFDDASRRSRTICFDLRRADLSGGRCSSRSYKPALPAGAAGAGDAKSDPDPDFS
jgi:uncharacterized membrane protein YGL010W